MSLGPKPPMRCSADQVSLNIEGVVDGGVERNKVRMVQEHRGDQAGSFSSLIFDGGFGIPAVADV